MSENIGVPSPVAPSGDALLLGLAAHYAKAISCHLDFEDESLRTSASISESTDCLVAATE